MKKTILVLLSLIICSTGSAEVFCQANSRRDLRNMKLTLSRSLKVRGVYKDFFDAKKTTLTIPTAYCKPPLKSQKGVQDILCDISFHEDYRVQLWMSSKAFAGHKGANGILIKGTIKDDINARTAAYMYCKLTK